jgi:hypothetical protein
LRRTIIDELRISGLNSQTNVGTLSCIKRAFPDILDAIQKLFHLPTDTSSVGFCFSEMAVFLTRSR